MKELYRLLNIHLKGKMGKFGKIFWQTPNSCSINASLVRTYSDLTQSIWAKFFNNCLNENRTLNKMLPNKECAKSGEIKGTENYAWDAARISDEWKEHFSEIRDLGAWYPRPLCWPSPSSSKNIFCTSLFISIFISLFYFCFIFCLVLLEAIPWN